VKANPRIQIVGRIPRDLRQAMTRAARQQRISLNRLIEDSLRAHIQPSDRPKGAAR
jgi:predicted HicB family RNase H-like nuclease